jgi:hypothetical protein
MATFGQLQLQSQSQAQAPPAVSDPHGSAKRKVAYFYDTEVGNYHYGQGHPMKVSAVVPFQ